MRTLAPILLLLAACGGQTTPTSTEETTAEASVTIETALQNAIDADHRSDEEKARDQFRHPKETLTFFGITPDMHVMEVWPGGGWYTNILAPYITQGNGQLSVAHFAPSSSERALQARAAFEEKFLGKPEQYGNIDMRSLGVQEPLADDESLDAVLTFRNVHNWMPGSAPLYFDKFFATLKPGGVLGVVEHRAAPDADISTEDARKDLLRTGYMKEEQIIALAERSGFVLEAKSEINANSADTRDHPFGVWTLPPVRRTSKIYGEDDPEFDRTKYDAIGESDRMTLLFRKPATTQ